MDKLNPDLRNFLRGAIGYLGGAAAGFLFVFLAARLGFVRFLFGLIDENQILVRVLAIPVFAGLMLALGGAVLGSLGGWMLATILGASRKRRQVVGSGIAFAVSVGSLTLIFLLLISFIALYNNFTTDRIEHYGIIFGLFGLVFGLITGVLHALMSVRLRDTWRVILAASTGFALGGVVTGLLVRLVNPTAGLRTYPILTTIVLLLALAAPFMLGGGTLGFTYGRMAKRITAAGETVESLQPSRWQTGIVALVCILAAFWFFGFLGQITSFLKIQPGDLQAQIAPETVGVQWSDPQAYSTDIGDFEPVNGLTPVVQNGPDQVEHKAWCSPEGAVTYQQGNGVEEQISFPGCNSTPALALDVENRAHLVWYSTELEDTNGVRRPSSIMVESIRTDQGWSEPAIAARTAGPVTLSLTADEQGNLTLVWEETDQSRFYSAQEVYSCNEQQLSYLELAGMQAILEGNFRPVGVKIPYCRNSFRRILYTPNPDPQFSDEPITSNGGFDMLSSIAETVKYEVLFTTMQWEPDTSPPNPGSVLANAAADLYKQIKADPQSYPRGLTLRILLGNYPVVSNFQWGSQIMDAISDLRDAGIDKMVDPEIGWRLEVANYPGTYPHAHTKFMVVDGQRLTAVGFNYGYLHFPKDHPSGKGYDLFDLGLQVNGPVAQDAISDYDDMWDGADQVHCEDLSLENERWMDTCKELKATSDHVPEVLRTYLPPEGNTNSFSLYHTSKHLEADAFIGASLASAQETIDLVETNFSLDLICMVNIVFPDVCTIDNALPWMEAMLKSIENNGAQVRVIMENTNSNGLENRVSGKVLMDELKRKGLEDLVELRFYNGKVHAKSILIDQSLLIIGSQNLHYSAWGEGSLAEYNITTDDPRAIEEYQAMFESKWQEAIPFEEAEFGSSP